MQLRNNQIKSIDSYLKGLKFLTKLELSFNFIENIDCLSEMIYLKYLNVRNNNIIDIDFIVSNWFANLEKIEIDHNPIVSHRSKFKIVNKLKYAFINLDDAMIFNQYNNQRLKKRAFFSFFESFYIITNDNLNYLNCNLTISYLRKNVLFNLYYHYQIDQFISTCKLNF